MEVEFTGQLTGRRFRYDHMRQLDAPGRPGATMSGHHQGIDVETGDPVYVRHVAELTEFDVEDMRRVRHAITVAQLPAVRGCPTLVQLIDFEDRMVDGAGFHEDWGVVTAAWEWGEVVLLDELRGGAYARDTLAADVAAGVGPALAALHVTGLVHSDVAPNNVVRVDGVWKLADLDHVVRVGEPITGLPREPSPYRLPGADFGQPARSELDEHGLRTLLERIAAGERS